LHYTGVD